MLWAVVPRKTAEHIGTRNDYIVFTELYLFPKEMKNIDKTSKTMEKWSSRPFSGSGAHYAKKMY
jgi:hypothetical protein